VTLSSFYSARSRSSAVDCISVSYCRQRFQTTHATTTILTRYS